MEYTDGITEYYIHKGYTTKVFQISLYNDNSYKIIDDDVNFKYEYEEVHLTQAQYVERLRKRLKLREGGSCYLFATTLSDGSHALLRCRQL